MVAQNVTLLLGTVEMSRRGMWALFRLEWEQILRVAQRDDQRRSTLMEHGLQISERGPLYENTMGSEDSLDELRRRSLREPLMAKDAPVKTTKEDRIAAAISRNANRMASGVWELPRLDDTGD